MAARGRRASERSSLKRRTGVRPILRTIVVFCEGERTEVEYIKGLKRLMQDRGTVSVKVEVDPRHAVPLTLVEAAADRSRDGEIDEVWCVYDVEAPTPHPNLAEAKKLADRSGVRLAVSNPCFELWLLLHDHDVSAYLTTAQAVKDARRLPGVSGKGLDAAALLPSRNDAVRRAQVLDVKHELDGTAAPGNPSSGMHHFVMAVEA